jgi:DnaB-like helicase N terminal domain
MKGLGKRGRTGASRDSDLLDLPKATEAERVIVGAVLVDGMSNQHVLSKVSPDSFYRRELAVVFARFCAMRKQAKALDLPTVHAVPRHHRFAPLLLSPKRSTVSCEKALAAVAFILDTAAARQEDHALRLGSASSSDRALRYVFLRSHFGKHNAIQRFRER